MSRANIEPIMHITLNVNINIRELSTLTGRQCRIFVCQKHVELDMSKRFNTFLLFPMSKADRRQFFFRMNSTAIAQFLST